MTLGVHVCAGVRPQLQVSRATYLQPYVCPLDYILHLDGPYQQQQRHLKRLPEAECGPDIEWRESSFLEV